MTKKKKGNQKGKKQMEDYCSSYEGLKTYLRQKALTHHYYKCYSQVDRIRSIVQNKALFLTDGTGWNDVTDKDNFLKGEKDQRLFGKCFSYSRSESVAMWMLYGGIYCKGAMVDFSESGMNNILKASSIELGHFENDKFQSVQRLEKPDFDMWITDIVYYDESKGSLKRSDELCFNVKREVLDKLGFVKKATPWSYENECRLIISVPKNIILDGCDTVKINISKIDLGTSLERVYYCPNYDGSRDDGFQESKLRGKIQWDLRDKRCRNCDVLEG